MNRKGLFVVTLLSLVAITLATVSIASAQHRTQRHRSDDDDMHMTRNGRELETFRETIERVVPVSSGARIKVDPNEFGGITVSGWDREQMRLVAKKKTAAVTLEEARELAGRVQIIVEGGAGAVEICSEGPKRHEDSFWSVSYGLFVPRRADLDLCTKFGGISIEDVGGDIRFTTEFGGVDLSRVSGTVVGHTKFGGVEVELEGDRWEGERLDVTTEFGGVTLRMPKGYSAELETGTSFGSLNVDFPITIQGRIDRTKGIKTQLGSGGAPIRLMTKFGGVSIKER